MMVDLGFLLPGDQDSDGQVDAFHHGTCPLPRPVSRWLCGVPGFSGWLCHTKSDRDLRGPGDPEESTPSRMSQISIGSFT